MFCKKGVLRVVAKFTGKYPCQSPAILFKKEALAQLFSCKFCESSNNTFFHGTPLVAASVSVRNALNNVKLDYDHKIVSERSSSCF